jgi:hypothetical protein
VSPVARLPFPLWDVVPPILRDVVLEFWWDQPRLWSLELPVVDVAMSRLDWHLRLPLWAYDGKPFTVSPQQVAREPETFSEQYARTLAADLRFPLHVLRRPERLTILDGTHRLLKAHLEGRETVPVKTVTLGQLDDIARLAR